MSLRSHPASLGWSGAQVDAGQRLAQGADRLHRPADDDRLAVGHAALDAAGVVGAPGEAQGRRAPPGGVVADLVVDLGPGPAGGLEPQPDLDALERLDAHHGRPQAAVEPAVPGHARAEPDRAAEDVALDDAAGGVLGHLLLVDELPHGRVGGRRRGSTPPTRRGGRPDLASCRPSRPPRPSPRPRRGRSRTRRCRTPTAGTGRARRRRRGRPSRGRWPAPAWPGSRSCPT